MKNTFKFTKKNILMLKEMAFAMDKINKIVFADDYATIPYPDYQRIEDIKKVLTEYSEAIS